MAANRIGHLYSSKRDLWENPYDPAPDSPYIPANRFFLIVDKDERRGYGRTMYSILYENTTFWTYLPDDLEWFGNVI
jgi:hypothetical protein